MWTNSRKEGYGIEIYNKENSIYKGYFSNGKKMELDIILGMIIQVILESGLKALCMDMESIIFKMDLFTLAIGQITK